MKNVDPAKLKNIMAVVFDVDESIITEESSTDNVESWDSLRHINLVVALEQEFGVVFPDEEISFLTSFSLLQVAISEYLQGL